MSTSSIERGMILLPIARASIARQLGRHDEVAEDAPWLQEQGACFVTLMQHDRLRGCIGTLEARRTLLNDIKANAQAAAFHDSRFAPLRESELDDTEIEVSVLSAMEIMHFTSERDALTQLRPDVDGVVFEWNNHRSTFLPQVWDNALSPVEFMALLKNKAGLPADFWAKDVKLSRYTVQKWKERDLPSCAKMKDK